MLTNFGFLLVLFQVTVHRSNNVLEIWGAHHFTCGDTPWKRGKNHNDTIQDKKKEDYQLSCLKKKRHCCLVQYNLKCKCHPPIPSNWVKCCKSTKPSQIKNLTVSASLGLFWELPVGWLQVHVSDNTLLMVGLGWFLCHSNTFEFDGVVVWVWSESK